MRAISNGQQSRSGQRGTTAVEFAFIAVLFFTIIFGIVEFGRVMYVWNTVQEVTRRAAREAVVRHFGESDKVARFAVFSPESGTGTAYLPAGLEITNANVKISYLTGSLETPDPMPLDPADNLSACNNPARATTCIRFVEACVATDDDCSGSLKYAPMVGLFPFLAINIPVSSVIMPAESLGFSVSP